MPPNVGVGHLQTTGNIWPMTSELLGSYQCARNLGSLFSAETVGPRVARSGDRVAHQQPHSSGLHSPRRGHSFSSAHADHAPTVHTGVPVVYYPVAIILPWRSECRSGCPLPSKASGRMGPSSRTSSQVICLWGAPEIDLFTSATNTMAPWYFSINRRDWQAYGFDRPATAMALPMDVRLPDTSPHSAVPGKAIRGYWSTDAHLPLVAQCSMDRGHGGALTVPPLLLPTSALIQQSTWDLRELQFVASILCANVTTMQDSLRKLPGSFPATFTLWCVSHGLEIESTFAPLMTRYLCHLFHERGLAAATLGVHRTAISSITAALGEDLQNSHLLQHFMEAVFLAHPLPRMQTSKLGST